MRVNIRGIGATSNTTVEPSVAVFLDGAYVPRVGAVVSSHARHRKRRSPARPAGHPVRPERQRRRGLVPHRAAAISATFRREVTGEIGNGDRYKVAGYRQPAGRRQGGLPLRRVQQWFKGYWHNELDDKQVGGTDDTILRGSFRGEVGPVDWVFRADYSQDERRRRDQHRLRPQQCFASAVDGLQQLLLGAPDTDLNDRNLNQFVTADVDDEQWGLNSTLSWDVGGGSTVRLINAYRDWKNTQLDGDVVFTPTPVISRTGTFDSKSQNHELQFISPTETVARRPPRSWSRASTTSTRSTARANGCT